MLDAMISKYLEAASDGVPLRYVIGFLVSIVVLTCPPVPGSDGVVDALLQLSLLDLFSLSHWKAVDPRIGLAVIATVLVAWGAIAERGISTAFFHLANRRSQYREKVAETYRGISVQSGSIEARATRLQLLETTMKPVLRRFTRSVAASQLSFIVAFAVLFCGGAALDVAIFLILLLVGIVRTIATVRLFIAEYFPLLALRSVLHGMPPPAYLSGSDA